MKRKIAVILAAGVDRYKERIASDEDGTLAGLARCRGLLEASVASHDGRVFNSAGDALLAEFASAVEAVRCAASVQRALRAAAAERARDPTPAPCLDYRIGITLGDVMLQPGGDLLGDGVNVAARLQGIAGPGGIAVSRSIVEHAAAKLPLAFVDRGLHALKNIPEPVHAYTIDLDGKPTGRPAARRPGGPSWLKPAVVAGGGLALAAALALALLPRDGRSSGATRSTATTPAVAASSPVATAVSPATRCAEILERAQLGRLTAEDRATLQRDCR